jgi:hypothetical protein
VKLDHRKIANTFFPPWRNISNNRRKLNPEELAIGDRKRAIEMHNEEVELEEETKEVWDD